MNAPTRGHILVVEDDQLLGEMLAELLEGDGFTASFISSAESAQSMLATTKPHCVLSDLLIPGSKDLVALCQRLAIPVIIATGFRDANEVFPVHCPPILHKPFRLAELVDYIESAVRSVQELSPH